MAREVVAMRLGRDPREFPDYKQPACFERGDHSAGQTCIECNPEYYLNNNRERKVEKRMAQVVGKVGVLTTDAKGNFKLKVDDKWYSTGSNEDPGVTQGQMVQFDFELSKPWRKPGTTTDVYFNNITKGTLRAVTDSKSQQSSASASTTARPAQSTGGVMSKDDYWRAKEERDLANEAKRDTVQQQIMYQAARNAAIEFVKILVGEKAIQYSTAQTKQTPAARLEVLEAVVDKYTTQFLEATQALGPQTEEVVEQEDVFVESSQDAGSLD